MVSILAVGATFIIMVSVLLFGSYAALMPTELTVTVFNRDFSAHEVELLLTHDGQNLTSWQLNIDPGKSRSVQYQLDIGGHRLTAVMQGARNATADFDIPFKFIDKTHSEDFTVAGGRILHGPFF